MIKGSKQIVEQGGTSTPEVQPVAFKATEEEKKESTPSRIPIDASKLDNEEMALIIKSFHQILKQRRGKDYKPRSKKVCYKCGKLGHFIAKCPISSDSDRGNDKKGKRKEKEKYYKKKGGNAHICREWDSDMSSTDSSSDEDVANIAVNKGLLFPNAVHKCLMAKDGKKKKVKSRICHDTISNLRIENAKLIAKVEKSNECDDSIANLKNDNASLITKIDKLNESISSLKIENDKLISKAKDLNVCNVSISCLRDENDMLKSKIDELKSCKPSTSTVDHVSICMRCRDINVDAIHDHIAMIKQQNDHIAKLDAKIAEHELENENFKFARTMLYNERRPSIKDGIGFQQGDNVKLNAPKKLSNFVKGKAPMAQDNEGYILYHAGYPEHKIRRIHARKL
jgi:hypothetical protein